MMIDLSTGTCRNVELSSPSDLHNFAPRIRHSCSVVEGSGERYLIVAGGTVPSSPTKGILQLSVVNLEILESRNCTLTARDLPLNGLPNSAPILAGRTGRPLVKILDSAATSSEGPKTNQESRKKTADSHGEDDDDDDDDKDEDDHGGLKPSVGSMDYFAKMRRGGSSAPSTTKRPRLIVAIAGGLKMSLNGGPSSESGDSTFVELLAPGSLVERSYMEQQNQIGELNKHPRKRNITSASTTKNTNRNSNNNNNSYATPTSDGVVVSGVRRQPSPKRVRTPSPVKLDDMKPSHCDEDDDDDRNHYNDFEPSSSSSAHSKKTSRSPSSSSSSSSASSRSSPHKIEAIDHGGHKRKPPKDNATALTAQGRPISCESATKASRSSSKNSHRDDDFEPSSSSSSSSSSASRSRSGSSSASSFEKQKILRRQQFAATPQPASSSSARLGQQQQQKQQQATMSVLSPSSPVTSPSQPQPQPQRRPNSADGATVTTSLRKEEKIVSGGHKKGTSPSTRQNRPASAALSKNSARSNNTNVHNSSSNPHRHHSSPQESQRIRLGAKDSLVALPSRIRQRLLVSRSRAINSSQVEAMAERLCPPLSRRLEETEELVQRLKASIKNDYGGGGATTLADGSIGGGPESHDSLQQQPVRKLTKGEMVRLYEEGVNRKNVARKNLIEKLTLQAEQNRSKKTLSDADFEQFINRVYTKRLGATKEKQQLSPAAATRSTKHQQGKNDKVRLTTFK